MTRTAGRWIGVLVCLGLLVGCARYFPSEPSTPGLGLIRVGNTLEIRLPRCATGAALNIRITDNTPSQEETPLVVLWDVERPWPKGATRFVVGKMVQGDEVRTPFVPLDQHPYIAVEVRTRGKSGWLGVFDLRTVTTELNRGEGYSKPISQADLDRIGGCDGDADASADRSGKVQGVSS
jgi:hypothetical protein